MLAIVRIEIMSLFGLQSCYFIFGWDDSDDDEVDKDKHDDADDDNMDNGEGVIKKWQHPDTASDKVAPQQLRQTINTAKIQPCAT